IVAEIDHQPLQIFAAQLLDRFLHQLAGRLLETGDAQVADARREQESAIHAGRIHQLRSEGQAEQTHVSRTADVELRLPLARSAQQLHQLLEFEPRQDVAIDRQDLITRSETSLGAGSSLRGLKYNHAARQHTHDGAESLALALLHLLE